MREQIYQTQDSAKEARLIKEFGALVQQRISNSAAAKGDVDPSDDEQKNVEILDAMSNFSKSHGEPVGCFGEEVGSLKGRGLLKKMKPEKVRRILDSIESFIPKAQLATVTHLL